MKNATYQTRISPENSELKPFSHSILSAVNTCPMWGVIRYGHRKQYPSSTRAMALEFGSAAHDVFAAIYLYQVGYIQGHPKHMLHHARRIFGDNDRFERALHTKDNDPDARDHLVSLGFNILRSGEFYNDPSDNMRTMENLELGIIKYIDNVLLEMEALPIFIMDKEDETKPIGIELPFDIELERYDTVGLTKTMRYIGQIDRLLEIDNSLLRLGENKTGSRLDSSWALSFDMSHQITGYNLAVETILNRECRQVSVHGLKNKQTGHSDDFSPISPIDRDVEKYETFIDWALFSKDIYDTYMEDWESAPRFTHSCNRYFRPCSLLSFCTDTIEGRKDQFMEMIQAPLSPSEEAVLNKTGLLND